MKISIIIPVYQSEAYIGSCIDSIFNQECDEADIECIIVDDCTQDRSMEIVGSKLNEYQGKIQFITIRHNVNRGHCAARNTALGEAKGDYVIFVDSDDCLEYGSIKYFLDSMGNEDVDVVMGNTFDCRAGAVEMVYKNDIPLLIDNFDEAAFLKLLSRELLHTSWNKLVKRTFFTRQQLYFVEGIINEDHLWSYLIFKNAKKVLLLPKVTYIHKENPLSISSTSPQRIHKRIESRIIICNTILDNPPKRICPEYFSYLYSIMVQTIDMYYLNEEEMYDLQKQLFSLRKRYLRRVWDNGYHLLFLHYLTLKKPFYYLCRLRLYRRYFNRISKFTVSLSQ